MLAERSKHRLASCATDSLMNDFRQEGDFCRIVCLSASQDYLQATKSGTNFLKFEEGWVTVITFGGDFDPDMDPNPVPYIFTVTSQNRARTCSSDDIVSLGGGLHSVTALFVTCLVSE